MKTLFIVQSNFGKGHHARVNAFADAIDNLNRLIITKPFNGQGKDTEFFGDTWNDLLFDYLEYDPDILITEGFPFGRYGWHPHFNKDMTKHEGIVDILEDAKSRNKKIYSLDRDLPWVNPDDGWFHAGILNKYYDGIIFHTDRNFIDTKDIIHNPIIDVPFLYTDGYSTSPFNYETKREGILFAFGDWFPYTENIYNIALDLKKQIGGKFTFIVGNKTPEELINKLRKQNCYIEKRKQTDGYRKLLASHEVSVSNFGAGTFLDINITKTPAVMIPNPIPRNSPPIYDEQGNVISNEEQFRAERYEKVDNGKVLMYDNLNTSTLGTAIENAKKLKPKSFNMNGREFVRNLLCTN
jgi:predicted glycosyltransferase